MHVEKDTGRAQVVPHGSEFRRVEGSVRKDVRSRTLFFTEYPYKLSCAGFVVPPSSPDMTVDNIKLRNTEYGVHKIVSGLGYASHNLAAGSCRGLQTDLPRLERLSSGVSASHVMYSVLRCAQERR